MRHRKCIFAAVFLSAALLLSGCGGAGGGTGTLLGESGTSSASLSGASSADSGETDGQNTASGISSADSGEADGQNTESAASDGGEQMSEREKAALEKVQGRWVDVNGASVLEITGNRMDWTEGSLTDSYTFRVCEEGGVFELKNQEGWGNFGIMSSLRFRDGEMVAYEEVLDADGHSFRFVREDKKKALLEIVDRSKDLPKVIESREIEAFSLNFSLDYSGKYGLEGFPTGVYGWEIDKEKDGTYAANFRCMGPSYVTESYRGKVDDGFMEELAEILADESIAGHNGYSMSNAVSKPSIGLDVRYASGERISIYAAGDAADSCVFNLQALMDHAKKMGIFSEE